MSGNGSVSPPSVFDRPDERGDRDTEPTTQASDEPGAYDLKPPPPAVSHENIEALADRFFSVDHLDTILRNPSSGPRFISFLNEHRPHHATSLTHYIESKKAITAIQYANAIADQIPSSPGESPHGAATLNEAFESKSRRIVEDLVEEALPAYLTHRLVTLTTDTMVKEITGNGAPYMKELIPNLAEVYCISDPSLPDSPIVYASEGRFFNVLLVISMMLLILSNRILQRYAIRSRLRNWSKLPLFARTEILPLDRQTSSRRSHSRRRNLRDHCQLQKRRDTLHEPPHACANV